jgi:hypothetical protein
LKFQKPAWDLGHACRETLPGNRKLICGSKSRNLVRGEAPNDSQVGAQFTWLTLFVDIYGGYTVRLPIVNGFFNQHNWGASPYSMDVDLQCNDPIEVTLSICVWTCGIQNGCFMLFQWTKWWYDNDDMIMMINHQFGQNHLIFARKF